MTPWSLKTPETFLAHCLKQMAHFMLVVQKLSQIIFMSIQPTLDCFFCAWPANIKIFLLKKKKTVVLLGRSATFVNLSFCGYKMFPCKLLPTDNKFQAKQTKISFA